TPTVDPLPETNILTKLSSYNELPKTGEINNKYYKYIGIVILVTLLCIIFSLKKEKFNV
ncbi:LPXTG-motif protein cell wall anchor domain protein, partial [Enterococcus faecalis KI-6-1-110608-1]